MLKKSHIYQIIFGLFLILSSKQILAQGNRLSIQCSAPKKLSICGLNDTVSIEVYNISFSPVNNISLVFNFPTGISYVNNSVSGGSVAESNVSNLNQPIFSAPNLGIAQNFKFKIVLKAECGLLNFLNGNNTPVIAIRANYTGNFDNGNSNPFAVNVPSVQFVSITNPSFSGDLLSKFSRTITIGNFGKGVLKEIKIKRINGKDVQIFKVNNGNNTFSNDTVTTIFNGNHFKLIGNKDTFLDQNESIVLTDSLIIKGCKNLNTNYELSWGCGGKTCLITRASNSALISNKLPNLKGIPVPTYPVCYDSVYHTSELKITNIGNYISKNNKVTITQYYTFLSSFDTSALLIKVGHKGIWKKTTIDSTVNTYNLGAYSCLGSQPIMLFRLLSPDLLPGDTLFIKWRTFTCIPKGCVTGFNNNGWYYSVSYKDQCRNNLSIPLTTGRSYNTHNFASTSFGPTDLINQQTGEFRTLISTASVLSVGNNAQYFVDLVLPKGLTHSLLKKDLYFIDAELSNNWNPDSVAQRGDTVRGYFKHPIPISLINAELVFFLKADCSQTGANGNKNIQMNIRHQNNSSCGKKEIYYLTCVNISVKLHCGSNCNGGMMFKNFSVKRINYGMPDNNNDGLPDNSGVLDSSKIRKERALFGDTIETRFSGVAKRIGSTTSFRNLFVESNIGYGKFLKVVSAEIYSYRSGTLRVNCIRTNYVRTISGNNANYKFDFSIDSLAGCVSSSYTYRHSDSFEIVVKYKVSENINGVSVIQNYANLFYLSNSSNPNNANKFQCDTFSGRTILAGYYYANHGADNISVNSCNQLAVSNSYYLGIGPCCSNYAGNNFFPYEYRNFSRLKAVRLYLPNGYKHNNSYINLYRTAGSNKTKLEVKDTIRPINTQSYPLVFDLNKHYKDSTNGVFNYSDDGFLGSYVAYLQPSCEVDASVQQKIRYDFIFERRNSFGTGFDTLSSGVQDDNIVYNRPTVTIKPISPIIYAAQDTAEWELTYTNYSSTFSNLNTWFSPDNSGSVKVVQIKDASKDTLIPSTNNIYRIGTIGFNNTRKFKIRAIYNTCNKDSIIIYSGWNCGNYPSDINKFNCTKDRIALYIEPQNTQFQVSLIDSTSTADLCAQTTYQYILENIGSTKAYNTKAILNLPIGMKVVSGSAYIKYPHKSSKVSIPNPSNTSGTSFQWNLSQINTEIAKGFSGVNDTNKNKIIIYFKVQTDCDYSSGNYLRASASGNIKCGNSIITYPAISNPLNIKGVTRPYYSLLKVSSDSLFPCEKASKVKVTIINLGPDKTGIQDKYQAILLKGMNYDSSLYNAIRNAPNHHYTKLRNINGATELEYSLPSNINPGDSIEFEFGFQSDGQVLSCGETDLYSQAAVKQEVVCVADNSKCNINVITGNNLLNPKVVKGSIAFEQLKMNFINNTSDSEFLNVQFKIKNWGKTIKSNNPIRYQLVYDKNGSGTIDINDEIVFKDTITQDLKPLSTIDINKNVKVFAGQSCALFVVLDSNTCSCNFSFSKFPAPILRNIGNKTLEICSESETTIGTTASQSFEYQWSPSLFLSSEASANTQLKPIYSDTGALHINYILNTKRGLCSSNDTIKVKVYHLPQIIKIQKDTAICEGQKVQLKINTIKGYGPHKILWSPSKFLTDSVSKTVTANNTSNQTFYIQLKDQKSCGAKDSIIVKVNTVPKANFIYQKKCYLDSTILIDSSNVKNDLIKERKWRLNNIDTFNVLTLKTQINSSLKSLIRLEVKTNNGCSDTIFKTIEAFPLPKANFSFQNVCLSEMFQTNNNSSIANDSIIKNYWHLSDGSIDSTINLKHFFAYSDSFSIELRVKSKNNCWDSMPQKAMIYPMPKAQFSVNDVCLGDSSHLINNSVIIKDSIIFHQWHVEQEFSNSKDFNYLFKKDSLYPIQLKVKTAHQCWDSTQLTSTVNTIPKANFAANPVCELTISKILNQSTISKDSILNWFYSTEDGNSFQTKNFNHLFNKHDTFDIQLIVESSKNCKDTIVKTHIVYPKINPNFSFKDICINDSLRVLDKSTFNNTNIKTWKWHFTPKDSSSIQNPSFKYANWGLQNEIHLIVTSEENCSYDTALKVNVYPLPIVNFKDTNQCIDNQFNFTNLSKIIYGSIINFNWYFDDNSQSNLIHPYHKFPKEGLYQVKLIAESDYNCLDSIVIPIQSYPPVVVDFKFNNVCLENPINFIENSQIPNSSIKSLTYDFGDGNTSNQKDPIHFYKTAGIYKVNHQITTAYNCQYDTNILVEIYPKPTAKFELDKEETNILFPEINISDWSIGADSIWYNLGEGSFSNQRNLLKLYPDSGYYTIKQYALTKHNCLDSFEKTLKVNYMFVFNAPNAFSPNGDGVNDIYKPGGIGTQHYEMRIFNRWGEMVFVDTEKKGWDGTYLGKKVAEGLFSVVFKVKDYKGRYHYLKSSFIVLY